MMSAPVASASSLGKMAPRALPTTRVAFPCQPTTAASLFQLPSKTLSHDSLFFGHGPDGCSHGSSCSDHPPKDAEDSKPKKGPLQAALRTVRIGASLVWEFAQNLWRTRGKCLSMTPSGAPADKQDDAGQAPKRCPLRYTLACLKEAWRVAREDVTRLFTEPSPDKGDSRKEESHHHHGPGCKHHH